MAKVKKTALVTGVRNVKASKKKAAKTANKARKTRSPKPKAGSTSTVKSISKARARAKQATKSTRKRVQATVPALRVVVKPLEPQAKCGAGTSVQYLFRVDETVDGRTTTHLVFFDRHGWYCEHGRTCPAVGHAKKYQGHIARAS